jgi:hypothetical protein
MRYSASQHSHTAVLPVPHATRQAAVAAITAVLDRHDALRARVSGEPEWRVETLPAGSVAAEGALRESAETDVAVVLEQTADRLDPARAAVIAFTWLTGGHDRLMVAGHPAVIDEESWRIVLDDVATAWSARAMTGPDADIAWPPVGAWPRRPAPTVRRSSGARCWPLPTRCSATARSTRTPTPPTPCAPSRSPCPPTPRWPR